MGKRRFAQIATSDEEASVPVRNPQSQRKSRHSASSSEEKKPGRRRRIKLRDDEEEEEEEAQSKRERRERREKRRVEEEEEENEEEEEEEPQEDAKPLGEVIRVSGKGRGRRSHYSAFEFDGNQYELEDPVLLVPEETDQKPYVAIIKDITQTKNGGIMVSGQWFYRPEEAERKGGGNWQSRDTRELFYSFHRDEIPAESVMHKCVVHFVPKNKQLPSRKQHPGFIVQKVYDTVERKLWKLTDKDYEDIKQHEIDILVQKTLSRLGDLPDIVETFETAADKDDQLKTKRTLRKRTISPLDVTRDEEATARLDHHMKSETPGSCPSNLSEYHTILTKSKALTGETHRDKWLERLLQGIQYMCISPDQVKEEVGNSDVSEAQEKNANGDKSFQWPDAAVLAVAALEKVTHDALSSDFQKYNQKLRQLVFNLKNNALLARRLLNGELEPSKILNMSPIELKEGLTAEETARKEPDDLERIQMTDARCSRCNEFKVGLRDIIQAGHGDRYQLECIACGNSWYASRDEASRLTIEAPSSKPVGTVPLATTKFESAARDTDISVKDAFKKATEASKLESVPRDPEISVKDAIKKATEASKLEGAARDSEISVKDAIKKASEASKLEGVARDTEISVKDAIKKASEASKFESVARDIEISVKDAIKKASEVYMPVLETQKSFGKLKNDDKSELVKKED